MTERKAAANRASRRKVEALQLAGIRADKNEIGLKMDAVKEQYEEKQKVHENYREHRVKMYQFSTII